MFICSRIVIAEARSGESNSVFHVLFALSTPLQWKNVYATWLKSICAEGRGRRAAVIYHKERNRMIQHQMNWKVVPTNISYFTSSPRPAACYEIRIKLTRTTSFCFYSGSKYPSYRSSNPDKYRVSHSGCNGRLEYNPLERRSTMVYKQK